MSSRKLAFLTTLTVIALGALVTGALLPRASELGSALFLAGVLIAVLLAILLWAEVIRAIHRRRRNR